LLKVCQLVREGYGEGESFDHDLDRFPLSRAYSLDFLPWLLLAAVCFFDTTASGNTERLKPALLVV
jgi:hypothetical protein